MTVHRIKIMLGIILTMMSLAQAASDDRDSHFVYFDYGKKISMDFKDASLTDILKIFSKQSGMNFISAQDVSDKKITLFLNDIPVEEALEKILNANDLTYEMSPNSDVFIVKPRPKETQLVTRFFGLKYATVSGAKIASASGSSADTGGIAAAVKAVLSKDGKLQEDARTNSFIITDIPVQFPLIEETLIKLDVPVLQILIQVEILDVSKGTSDKIGIKYGQTPFKFTGGQRSSFFPFDEDLIGRKATNLDEDNPLIKWTRVDTGYDFSGMTAALEFLRGQSSSRTLARPRLLTLNNQTASIQISTNEAIGLNTVSSSTTTTSSQTVAQAERVQTGVALEVTPQANLETGEIILAVAPKVTEAKQGGTFGGQSFKDPEERSSKSILKVKNGETIMIGGLLRTANTESVSKLPILGDMPLIGAAFRHKSKDTSERELIIFITPYIIDEKYRSQLNNPSSVRLDREVKQPQHMDTINQQLDSLEMGY